MKKGVIASIVISIVLTLTLAITTIATAFGGSITPEPNVYLAYRTGDVCVELDEFKSVNFNFDVNDSASMIVYNSENNEYEANAEGSCTVTAVKNNGKTCEVTIDVFAQGDGTVSSPWVIANASHVIELSELSVAETDTYGVLSEDFVCEVKADVDMLGVNFKPIGDRNHVFKGTIIGNNKTISNISINVTENNYQEYLTKSTFSGAEEGYLDLALISNADGAVIEALNINSMSVTVAENVKAVIEQQIEEDASVLEIARLRRVTVGSLVAYASNTQILGDENNFVIVSINSFSYANDYEGAVSTGLGGVIGVGTAVTVKDYKVSTRLTINQSAVQGTIAGGVIGYTSKTTTKNVIDNVNVTLTANTVYNNNAQIAGIVSRAYNVEISNCEILGIGVSGNEKFENIVASEINTDVAGAVVVLGEGSTLTNVSVSNASVDVKVCVAGIALKNFGTIKNCSFNGNLTGYSVAGLVNNNQSEVVYDETFSGVAVQGTLRGVRVGGLVDINEGTLNGLAGEDKVIISPIIRSVSSVVTNEQAVTAIRESYIAGVAVENVGEISNFNVQATLYDGLNMAGLVSIMGNNEGSISSIHDIIARVAISSNNLTSNNSTTYSIGGAVGFAYSNATIENISLNVYVNKDALASRKYGVSQLGGLVARIYADGVTIKNNTVSGYMFANQTWYTTTITDSEGNNPVNYNALTVGGLIGSIAGFGNKVDDNKNPIDAHELIDLTSATVISGNSIDGLDIIIEFNDNGAGKDGARIKSVGSIVGAVANKTGTLNLADNTITNLTIVANRATFSYGNECYIDSGLVHVYGSANSPSLITEPLESNIENRVYVVE